MYYLKPHFKLYFCQTWLRFSRKGHYNCVINLQKRENFGSAVFLTVLTSEIYNLKLHRKCVYNDF